MVLQLLMLLRWWWWLLLLQQLGKSFPVLVDVDVAVVAHVTDGAEEEAAAAPDLTKEVDERFGGDDGAVRGQGLELLVPSASRRQKQKKNLVERK